MTDFSFGIQPNKEGQFVLYESGKEVTAYPTPQAALNAVIIEARSRLSASEESLKAAEAHIALLKATVSKLSGIEERLAVAMDWIEGIPCFRRPGLLEDKKAILSALKKAGE